MSLVKKDKERQLIELALIVTGIRLFNRDCGKGGEGIDDSKFTRFLFHKQVIMHFLGFKLAFGRQSVLEN